MILKPFQQTSAISRRRVKQRVEAPRRKDICPSTAPTSDSAIKSPYQDRHVRPRVQRAFLRWFEINRMRFAILPRIVRRIDHRLTLSFTGITPLISAFLSDENIHAVVEIDGTRMDTLFSSDLFLKRDRNGYFCTLCDWQSAENHLSRESLWIEHVFESFLRWVNDTLAPAQWLRVLNVDHGAATSARLIQTEEECKDSDPDLHLLRGLKKLDGGAAFSPDNDQINVSLVPICVRAPRSMSEER